MPQPLSDPYLLESISDDFISPQSVVEILLMRMEQDYPEQTNQAREALNKLLLPLIQSTWPEVAWLASSLTPNGFPLELSFSSTEQAIRYTTEIAGPEVSTDKRLQLATKLIENLAHLHMDPDMYQCLSNIQQSGKLDYGAWVSGRHGVNDDRYKLYAEVPADGDLSVEKEFVLKHLNKEWILSERTTPLRMIGVDPVNRRTELYFKDYHLEFHQLYKLLALTGDKYKAEPLIDFIQKECSWPDKGLIPGNHCGFSYSVSYDKTPTIFSLFFSAHRFWGDDETIRQNLFRLVELQQFNLDTYISFMNKFKIKESLEVRHTLITLTVLPSARIGITIGLVPDICLSL